MVTRANSPIVGSIVQIDPNHDTDGFGGCLLVVTEVKAWGVVGYVEVPRAGRVYYRVDFDKVEDTRGRAPWVDSRHVEPERVS